MWPNMMKCDFLTSVVVNDKMTHKVCNKSAEKYFIGVFTHGHSYPNRFKPIGMCTTHYKPFLEEVLKLRSTDLYSVTHIEISEDEAITTWVMNE
jgi:hypothetical protein